MAGELTLSSPLALDGWLEFNCRKWNLRPRIMEFKEDNKGLPLLKAILYFDKNGHVRMPPINPYLPIEFSPTPTEQVARISRQWLCLGSLMADEIYKKGLRGTVSFPPEVSDLRPFQWKGFNIGVRYTFHLNLPVPEEQIDHAVRKQIRKALRSGFECRPAVSSQDVISCLLDTENRQGFSHGLSTGDIDMARDILGEEYFRVYGCYAPNGGIASARIVLHFPGCRAIDWVAGTKREFLNSGATQAVIAYALNDLAEVGARSFDFAGANIPNVAAAKVTWGGRLVPFYTISAPSLRGLVKYALDMIRYRQGGRGQKTHDIVGKAPSYIQGRTHVYLSCGT